MSQCWCVASRPRTRLTICCVVIRFDGACRRGTPEWLARIQGWRHALINTQLQLGERVDEQHSNRFNGFAQQASNDTENANAVLVTAYKIFTSPCNPTRVLSEPHIKPPR